jgi:hypothetical protein
MDRPTFPLIVHDDERPVLRLALKVYSDDLGHREQEILDVAAGVTRRIVDDEHVPVDLDAADMKVTWSALHALLNDSVRTQEDEREHLHALLDRMPGEHDIRAIDLDTELKRRR